MNPSRKSNQGRRLIAILVQTVEIGVILLLGVAVFFLWRQLQASSQQLQQSTGQMTALQTTVDALKLENEQLQASIQPTATPETEVTESSNLVAFSDPNNPAALAPMFGWQPGSAAGNAYDLTLIPGTLTLTAASGTEQWGATSTGPIVVHPVSGDFDLSVKVKTSPVENYQRAGIGIRSTQDVNTWVNITRNFHTVIPGGQGIIVLSDQQGAGSLVNSIPYEGEVCFFKIERRGSELDLSYSEDGTNWTLFQENYVMSFADPIEIFLTASSTSSRTLTAEFSELTLIPKP